MHVAESDDQARQRAAEGIMSYYTVIRETRDGYVEWLRQEGIPVPSRLRDLPSELVTFDRICDGSAIVGGPDTVREELHKLMAETRANQVLAWMNIGKVPAGLVRDSMNLLARKVLPEMTQ